MPKSNDIVKPKLLIVEGNQDYLFFRAWLSVLRINDQIQVMQTEGKDKLSGYLRALVKQPAFIRGEVITIIIVRDADRYPDRAFQSVISAVENAGLGRLRHAYEFIEHENIRVAAMIIPNQNQAGALEELLLQTIHDDPIMPDVRELIRQAVAKLPQPAPDLHPRYKHFAPPEHRRGKAHIHAFLSTYDEPERKPGEAALAGVWDFTHPALQPLLQILEQM